MTLPIPRTFAPMEARLVDELPTGGDWQYEPKWDGFRCLVFRDGDKVDLMSKAGRSLARYFPDLADLPYQGGNRDGIQQVKSMGTADCVVGGFRYASKGKLVGSLLLGLYDDGGLLHHVGFTSNIPNDDKPETTARLEQLIKPPGFTGQAPGGPSRWSTERSSRWEPLANKLVVEVKYDHFSDGRFRHETSFLRWRPDKAPARCTIAQVEQEGRSALALVPARR